LAEMRPTNIIPPLYMDVKHLSNIMSWHCKDQLAITM